MGDTEPPIGEKLMLANSSAESSYSVVCIRFHVARKPENANAMNADMATHSGTRNRRRASDPRHSSGVKIDHFHR